MQVWNPVLPVKFQDWNHSPRPAAVETVGGTIKTSCPTLTLCLRQTVTIQHMFFLATALNPHTVREAQEELVESWVASGCQTRKVYRIYFGDDKGSAPVGMSRANWDAEASKGG